MAESAKVERFKMIGGQRLAGRINKKSWTGKVEPFVWSWRTVRSLLEDVRNASATGVAQAPLYLTAAATGSSPLIAAYDTLAAAKVRSMTRHKPHPVFRMILEGNGELVGRNKKWIWRRSRCDRLQTRSHG